MPPLHPHGRTRRVVAAAAALSVCLLAPLAASGVAVAAGPAAAESRLNVNANVNVNVIVEFSGDSALRRIGAERLEQARTSGEVHVASSVLADYSAAAATIENTQRAFVDSARTAGVPIEDPRYLTGVIDAVAGTVDAADLEALRGLPGVARVSVDGSTHALTDVSVPAIGAPEVWQQTAPDGLPARGAGVTVAIIDTGVDYTLADLGGGFGEGHKVVGGYDVVDRDDDPMDDNFHGTHVAGIVAGTGVESVTGVAPDAELTAYKVLDADGAGRVSYAIEALDLAVSPANPHIADVINLSLGIPGDGSDPLGVASEAAAVYGGAVVVAAAGNSGPSEQTVSSPAAASSVLAVGASTTNISIPSLALETPARHDLATSRVLYSANPPAQNVTAPIVDLGAGTPADFEAAGDLTGAIVVYSGSIPRERRDIGYDLVQARTAEAKGAIAALVYEIPPTDSSSGGGGGVSSTERVSDRDEEGVLESVASNTDTGALESGDDLRLDHLVVIGTKSSAYAVIRDQVKAGGATATVSATDMTDTIASFSSRGPTDAMRLKPEIVAPGVDIRSLVPAYTGVPGHASRLSGTSMAAPHVAGAAALVRQMNPTLDQERVRETLVGSAAPLKSRAVDASPADQGAGLLDVAAAVHQSVFAHPAAASLGLVDSDAADPALGAVVTLNNASAADLTATLAIEPSDVSTGTATLDVSELTIPAGSQSFVTLLALPDTTSGHSEVSGVIVATLSDGTEMRIPYLGVSRSLSVQTSPDPSTGRATVFVHSDAPLDGPPVVEVTTPSGVVLPVEMSMIGEIDDDGLNTRPGWFDGTVDSTETGQHTVAVTGESAGSTQFGSGSFEVIAPLARNGTWQQLGRDSSSSSVATSPTDPDVAVLTSLTSSRPFVTTDHGVTWRHVRDLPVAEGEGTPIADPDDPRAFWFFMNGTVGQSVIDPSYEGVALRTEDLGETWDVLPFPDEHIYATAGSGQTLAAAVDDGVEYSTDGGRSWSHLEYRWPTPPSGIAIDGGDVVVVTAFGLYRVADVSGTPGAPELVAEGDTNRVFSRVTAENGTFVAGIYEGDLVRSTDGGATWSTVTTPTNNVTAITFDHGSLYVGSVNGYWTSTDRGDSFDFSPETFHGPVPVDFAHWAGDDETLLVSLENAGLYSTTDGKEFQRLGVSASSVESMLTGVDSAGTPFLRIADSQGTGTIALPDEAELPTDITAWGATGAEGWIGKGVAEMLADPDDPAGFWRIRVDSFAGTRIEHTTDGGASFVPLGPGGYEDRGYVLDPSAPGTQAVAFATDRDQGIIVTGDGWSKEWTSYSYDFRVRQLSADPSTTGRLWIAADEGVFVSDDFGRTVRQVSAEAAKSVWVDPADPAHVLVGGNGIRATADGGRTFTAADLPSTMLVGSFASAVRGTGTVYFAGTETYRPDGLISRGRGVLMSTDAGAHWSNVSAGLDATSVLSLATSPDGRWLLAGTSGSGVYRADIATLLGETPTAPPTETPVPPTDPTMPPTEAPAPPTDAPSPSATPAPHAPDPGSDASDHSAHGPLAFTGLGVTGLVVIGLLAVIAGGAFLLPRLIRRRAQR